MKKRLTPLVLAGLIAAVAVQTATAAPKPIGNGVVLVNTTLGYAQARAAGTGMVLTSSGEILTNNHVIKGATTVSVTVPGTSHTYPATVAGYSVVNDVAILRLTNATNLKTVAISTARAVLGQRVRALGNAGGTGKLTPAPGQVTGLGKSITADNEDGTNEALSGLIETNANVRPGDSGGPLFDRKGRVVGMNTAGSNSGAPDSYAIPISTALSIRRSIDAGLASTTVHVGDTAFLGVQFQPTVSAAPGALVAGVVPNGPAATAGLVAGDTITSIGGVAITAPSDIAPLMLAQAPGASVGVRTPTRRASARRSPSCSAAARRSSTPSVRVDPRARPHSRPRSLPFHGLR
jgi:S1-C subfamily serine protease